MAQHLRDRLARDPHVVERAANATGRELGPHHRSQLYQLQAHRSQSVSHKDAMNFFRDCIGISGSSYAFSWGFYKDLGIYTMDEFECIANGSATGGETTEYSQMQGLVGASCGLVHPGLSITVPAVASVIDGFEYWHSMNSEDLRPELRINMEALQYHVMGEAREQLLMVWEEFLHAADKAQVHEIRSILKVLLRDLYFMPLLLAQNATGAVSGYEKQVEFMWLLTVSHDLTILSSQLMGGSKCSDLTSPACINWQKHCTHLELIEISILHSQATFCQEDGHSPR